MAIDLNKELKKAEEFLFEMSKGLGSDERLMVVYAEEATVQVDAKGKKINAGFWAKPYSPGKFIPADKNCYVCISSMIKTLNQKTGEMRFWRTESAFGHGLAMMVDDIGDGKGSKGNLSLEWLFSQLPPTAVVETSPNNYQAYYFFDAPADNMAEMKAFLNCFVGNVLQDHGGDITIKDVTRVGRFPFGINNKRTSDNGTFKYVDDSGKPWRVRLSYANYSVRYSPAEIAKAFGFNIVMPVKHHIEVSEDEYKYDSIWLRLAERIMTKAKMGEGAGGEVSCNMSGKFRIRCPFAGDHANGDPFGAYFRGPIAGADHQFVFGCAHDACRQNKRTWSVFVDEVVMPEIEAQLEKANQWGLTWTK